MSDPQQDMLRMLYANEARLAQTETKEVPGITGTYTPTYLGLATPGATTYTTQVGRYMRIGQLVIVSVFLNWSAATGTGVAVISLPFAPLYTSSVRYAGAAAKSGNVRTAVAEAGAGAQACYLVTGGAAENVTGTGDITLTLSYFTA